MGSKTRLLVPLDGSELAAKALPVAEYLCRQLAGELHLVRVMPDIVLPYAASESYIPPEVYEQLRDDQEREAREYLEHAAADVRNHGIGAAVHTHLDWGEAASTVLELAAQLHPALVVMTTHGRTGLARFALGSVADRIVRGGEAPVLLLRSFPSPTESATSTAAQDSAQQGVELLSRALVPLDGSPLASAPLFSIALQLAGPVLHAMTLLRVVDPRDGIEGRVAAETYLESLQQGLLSRLEGRDCVVNTRMRVSSNPAQCIVECSQDERCDLVLMSTHGEAGIGRLAFGGVTDRVLRDGQLPLLLVHPPKR